ncbi:MAG: XRE family transcriptional regulator [Proteobacteria bacterium]|nr:XRE family transcriptional regulator [Pseudomonadota bacterium]
MVKKPYQDSLLAKFVEKRVLELQGKRTQAEIAAEAGFRTPNVVTMMKTGATKLPLDRVEALAKALETDPALLFRLALQQPGNQKTARAVAEIFGTVLTRNEVAWIEELRAASGESDPVLTEKRRAKLRRCFGR